MLGGLDMERWRFNIHGGEKPKPVRTRLTFFSQFAFFPYSGIFPEHLQICI